MSVINVMLVFCIDVCYLFGFKLLYCLFVFLPLQPIVVVFFHSPVAGFSLLVFRGFLMTHNDAPQSVGLLWTSDQSVAETST
jgi:hypothetical protein